MISGDSWQPSDNQMTTEIRQVEKSQAEGKEDCLDHSLFISFCDKIAEFYPTSKIDKDIETEKLFVLHCSELDDRFNDKPTILVNIIQRFYQAQRAKGIEEQFLPRLNRLLGDRYSEVKKYLAFYEFQFGD